MSQLLLLGTSACHLCEQAEILLSTLDIHYQKIDIAEEQQWQARYAIKIPVLLDKPTQIELCWPFDSLDISHFITQLKT